MGSVVADKADLSGGEARTKSSVQDEAGNKIRHASSMISLMSSSFSRLERRGLSGLRTCMSDRFRGRERFGHFQKNLHLRKILPDNGHEPISIA